MATNIYRLLVPRQLRAVIARRRAAIKHRYDHRLLTMAATKPLAAGLYFWLFNKELLREARAVAAGRLRYAEIQALGAKNFYLLRRNVHRLEKGLIMQPRRTSFATKYIGETVAVYERALDPAVGLDRAELQWATDVLTAYFMVVDNTSETIERARRRFEGIISARGISASSSERLIPFERAAADPGISIDDFHRLAMRRRSVRWYRDEPLPRALIDEAIRIAAQAPSACNRQPFVYRVFDDPAQAREIAGIAMGTKGFSHQIPALAVLVGQLRAYPYERDRHAIYIDASLSAMSFMFALETLGAASCPINWPDHEPYEARMKKRLQLEPDERVIMLIGFGWPDPTGLVPRSIKRDIGNIRSYNE